VSGASEASEGIGEGGLGGDGVKGDEGVGDGEKVEADRNIELGYINIYGVWVTTWAS
jgi:hypothetical protein